MGAAEYVMYKPGRGAFYRTGIEQRLRQSGSDTVVFAECNFPNCPRTSVCEASEPYFWIFPVSDALCGLYERGIQECHGIGEDALGLSRRPDWLAS